MDGCKYRCKVRTGLYLMVAGTIFLTCDNKDKLKELLRNQSTTLQQISALEQKLDKPSLRKENVIFGEKEELFYEIDGKKAYLEIDGEPIEKYVRSEHDKP